MSVVAYYFGCGKEPGHYLFERGMRKVTAGRLPDDFPVNPDILDGGLLPPKREQTEGQLHLNQVNGWTIISLWDRSIDKRMGSNCSFLCRGEYFAEKAYKIFHEAFPEQWNRAYLSKGT